MMQHNDVTILEKHHNFPLFKAKIHIVIILE